MPLGVLFMTPAFIGQGAVWLLAPRTGRVPAGLMSVFIAVVIGHARWPPTWWTGGAFGVESSVQAMVPCSTLGLTLLWPAKRRGHFKRACWKRAPTPR